MILTLRTLLAWLDDTTTLAEIAELGRIIEETPAAIGLVGRICEAAQGDLGESPADPDVVSNYIDNVLPEHDVPTYEALCLASYSALAEVAECHRILCEFRGKEEVPADARRRIHSLVDRQD